MDLDLEEMTYIFTNQLIRMQVKKTSDVETEYLPNSANNKTA